MSLTSAKSYCRPAPGDNLFLIQPCHLDSAVVPFASTPSWHESMILPASLLQEISPTTW